MTNYFPPDWNSISSLSLIVKFSLPLSISFFSSSKLGLGYLFASTWIDAKEAYLHHIPPPSDHDLHFFQLWGDRHIVHDTLILSLILCSTLSRHDGPSIPKSQLGYHSHQWYLWVWLMNFSIFWLSILTSLLDQFRLHVGWWFSHHKLLRISGEARPMGCLYNSSSSGLLEMYSIFSGPSFRVFFPRW